MGRSGSGLLTFGFCGSGFAFVSRVEVCFIILLFLSVSLLSVIQACVCVRAHRYCLLFAIGLGRKGGKGCVSEAWCLGFGLI